MIRFEISFDADKRERALKERGLDFLDAAKVFGGRTYDWIDDRFEYGEIRVVTVGWLRDRMVIVVWTQRAEARHVISMRKANDREKGRFGKYLG